MHATTCRLHGYIPACYIPALQQPGGPEGAGGFQVPLRWNISLLLLLFQSSVSCAGVVSRGPLNQACRASATSVCNHVGPASADRSEGAGVFLTKHMILILCCGLHPLTSYNTVSETSLETLWDLILGSFWEPKVSTILLFGRFFEGRCLGHFWKGTRGAQNWGAFSGSQGRGLGGGENSFRRERRIWNSHGPLGRRIWGGGVDISKGAQRRTATVPRALWFQRSLRFHFLCVFAVHKQHKCNILSPCVRNNKKCVFSSSRVLLHVC